MSEISQTNSTNPGVIRRATTVDHLLAESETSKFSHILTYWPSLIILAAFSVGFLCAGITLANIGLSDEPPRTYLVWSDIRIKRFDAYNLALEEYDDQNYSDSQLELQSEEIPKWLVWLVYEEKKDNLLLNNIIDEIYAFESGIEKLKNYDKVCYRRSVPSTNGSNTPTRACNVFATSAVTPFTKGSTQAEINTQVDDLFNNQAKYDAFKSLYDKNFTQTNKRSQWARTAVRFGAPINDGKKRYGYYLQDEEPQDDFMEDFAFDVADYVDDYKTSNMNIYFYNQLWFDVKNQELVLADFGFIGLSILFVLFYMMVHTRSVVIPIIGMFQVVLAFPMAYTLYTYIFQISFFNMMSLLSIFVILGIAADDMFVYMDTWKQSLEHEILLMSLEKRAIWTYRKAAHAMFVTTFTTFCAFMATGVSELMPIAAFGIFSACYILCNYLLVITSFPAVVVIREKFFVWRRLRAEAKQRESEAEAQNTAVVADSQRKADVPVADVDMEIAKNEDNSRETSKLKQSAAIKRSATQLRAKDMSASDKFFYTTYSYKLRQFRFLAVGLFVVWLGVAIGVTTQLTPPEEQENWIPEDHELRETTKAMEDNFSKSEDDGAQITHVVWGIDGVDSSGISDRWDPADAGDLEWDNAFNLSPQANQQSLWNFCIQLRNIQDNDIVRDGQVTCFIDTFKTYVESKGVSFPVPEADFLTHLKDYTQNSSAGQDELITKRVGLIKDRLRYVSFKVIGGDYVAAVKMMPRYDDWQDIIKNYSGTAPHGVNNPFQTSTFWLWMVSEEALVKNALEGIGIAGTISFVVLVISTLNIILATYAIICILGIIISVMAVMFFNGWDFGTAESIAVVILIGFSVDYVVHLCHAFIDSHSRDKVNRTRDALAKMGFSILGGAVTTFGDGCMLFFCTIIFFYKFAWIVTSTIFFAVVWSLIFLPALLMIIGPQEDTGNLKVYGRQAMEWYRAKKKPRNS